MSKECVVCKKTFSRHRKQNDSGLCCSRECGFEYQRERRKRGGYGPRGRPTACGECGSASKKTCSCSRVKAHRRPVLKDCASCGIAFPTMWARKKYCSPDCMTYYTPRVTCGWYVCTLCGSQDYAISAVNRRRFCSRCRSERRRDSDHVDRAIRNGCDHEEIDITGVFVADHWTCQGCGCKCDKSLDPNDNKYPTLDHKTPISLGGGHVRENVWLLCRQCNTNKGTKTVEEWRVTASPTGGVSHFETGVCSPDRWPPHTYFGEFA